MRNLYILLLCLHILLVPYEHIAAFSVRQNDLKGAEQQHSHANGDGKFDDFDLKAKV